MASKRLIRLVGPMVATTLLAVACSGSTADQDDRSSSNGQTSAPTEESTSSTETANGAEGVEEAGAGEALSEIDPTMRTMLENLSAAYVAVDGVWDGYRPPDHAVVLAWRDDDGTLLGAVAINHPDPQALGQPVPIDTTDLALASVQRFDQLNEETRAKLDEVDAFQFNQMVGGAESFLMTAGGPEWLFDPSKPEYANTLLHELFHHYQTNAFAPSKGFQDIEGYAYTADNIELATLEDRALLAALQANADDERETAARHVAAIRIVRLAAEPRVVLDEDQEIAEGTARYIEHRAAGDDTRFLFHSGNYDADLVTDPTASFGVKDHYGFGRFYGSGAAHLRLLDDLGVDGVAGRVEAGESPASILAATLGVTNDEAEDLVAEARRRYDASAELAELAAAAAEQAATEPSVFSEGELEGEADGGEADGGPADDGEADGGPGEVLTPEELACLEDNGLDLEADEIAIPPEIVAACLGPLEPVDGS